MTVLASEVASARRLKLYWCPNTRANRVVWMLEELGLDYETVHVDVFRPGRSDELLAVSPMGKVPGLEDGDVRMCDSSAICLYPGGPLRTRRFRAGASTTPTAAAFCSG